MSSGGGDRGKSPGKGGKSLELMQKRMQIQQQQNQQQAPPGGGGVPGTGGAGGVPAQQQQPMPPPPQQLQQQPQMMVGAPQSQPAPMAPPRHHLPQGNVMNPLDLSRGPPAATHPHPQQPIVAHQQVNQVNTSSKPKGKDFSRMAIQAPRPVPVQPHHPPPSLPSPRQQQQQLQQQQPQPQQHLPPMPPPQTVQAAPVAGKPKGKDFSAMASRMTPDARAAAMQAGARQAAGLPPLERPTATAVTTAVTTTPPSIPPTPYLPPGLQHTQPQQQSQQPMQHMQPHPMQQPQHAHQLHQSHPHQPQPHQPQAHQPQPHQPQPHQPQTHQPHPVQQQGGVTYMGSSAPLSAPPPTVPQPAAAATAAGAAAGAAALHSRRNSGPSSEQPLSPPVASVKPTPAPSAREVTLASPHMAPLVGPRVRDLVRSLDPSYTIEASAERQVLELVDDFLEKVCKQSMRLATHRASKTMDVQDVQLILAKQWGITIPGLGPPLKSGTVKATPGNSSNNNKRKAASSSSASSSNKAQKTAEEPRPT